MSVTHWIPGTSNGTSAAGLSVVLIDPEPVVMEGLGAALGRAGHVVIGAFVDPGDAAGVLFGAPPETRTHVDLVVIDVRACGQAGLDLVAAVHRERPQVQVAVLTSVEDGAAAAGAIRAGARGFLLKNVATRELCGSLRSVAEGNLIIDSRMAGAVLDPALPNLSMNQLAIVKLIAGGLTNRQIAARLHLSEHTIRTYLSRAMRTLGTSSRAETVARLSQTGAIDVA